MMVIMESVKRTIKSIADYITGSALTVTFFFNPFSHGFWNCYFYKATCSDTDPGLLFDLTFKIPGIRVHFYIDNGSW